MSVLREIVGTHEKYSVFEPTGGVKGNRNPVIFLHAMLCSRKIWKDIPLLIAEATGRKVFTYDARCHGGNKDVKNFSFDALVQDLISFMTDQEIKKAVLVGHSMGGKTAITLALNAPERVEKVIIVDMHVATLPKELVMRSIKFLTYWKDAVQSLPASTPVEDVTKESVPLLYSKLDDEERLESEKLAYLASEFEYPRLKNGKYDVGYNADELEKGLDAYLKENKGEISGEYAGPAFFFYGEVSPYKVHKELDNIKKCFPKAEMLEFPGAPHHIFAHSRDKFIEALKDKINQEF